MATLRAFSSPYPSSHPPRSSPGTSTPAWEKSRCSLLSSLPFCDMSMAKLKCIPLPGAMVGISPLCMVLPFSPLIDESGEGPSLPKLTLSLEFQVSTQLSTFLRDLFPSTPPSVLCPSAFKDTQNFPMFKMPSLSLVYPTTAVPLSFSSSRISLGLCYSLHSLLLLYFLLMGLHPSPTISITT